MHFFRFENEKFEAGSQLALQLNPNDPETLADIGHYLAFMGEFDRGVALSERARQLNPLHAGWYYFSNVRRHLNQRNYTAAIADIQRVGMPDFYWANLLHAAALGHLGHADAGPALARLFAIKPDIDPRAELRKWNTAEGDADHIMAGLIKVGLREGRRG